MEIGRFTEISGLSAQIEVEEFAEGGQNQYKHKLPGRMSWPNLVLKRGITNSDELFQWFASCSGEGFTGAGNAVKRHDGTVEVLSPAGKPIRSWKLIGAFPVKWTGPRFVASSSDLAVEELEVCHCGIATQS